MKKIKEMALKALFGVCAIAALISGCCLDSEDTRLPMTILVSSLIYMAIYANSNTKY